MAPIDLHRVSLLPNHYPKFIVTHGTDTMIETAKYVAAAKGRLQKTVVFTGAMRPQKLIDSDAAFNIGVAGEPSIK